MSELAKARELLVYEFGRALAALRRAKEVALKEMEKNERTG